MRTFESDWGLVAAQDVRNGLDLVGRRRPKRRFAGSFPAVQLQATYVCGFDGKVSEPEVCGLFPCTAIWATFS